MGWGCDWVVLVLDPELVSMVLETPDRPMCNKLTKNEFTCDDAAAFCMSCLCQIKTSENTRLHSMRIQMDLLHSMRIQMDLLHSMRIQMDLLHSMQIQMDLLHSMRIQMDLLHSMRIQMDLLQN